VLLLRFLKKEYAKNEFKQSKAIIEGAVKRGND
jgi:hypothetical protein